VVAGGVLRLVWMVVAREASEVARIGTSLRASGRLSSVVGGLGANGFWDAKFGVWHRLARSGLDWKLELEMEMLLSRAIGLRT